MSGGHVRMLINGAVQIWVTAEPPHRLLSVGLSTTGASGQDAKPPSAFTTAAFTTTDNRRPPRDVRVQYAAARDQTPPSSLSSTVREASGAEAQSTAAAVKRLGETQAKPAELSERVTVQPDVSVHLRNISGSPCGSRTCSSVVTVTNEGKTTAKGTLLVSVAGQSVVDQVISVAPGASHPVTATAINTAPPNTVMPVTWAAVLYNSAVLGDDPELAKRLAGRGFNVSAPLVDDKGNGKAALRTLDAMTSDVSAKVDSDRIRAATGTIANVIRQRAFAPFYELAVMTDSLTVTNLADFEELRQHTAKLTPQDMTVLQHATDLARFGHKVTWGTSYLPAGASQAYSADILDLTTRQAIQETTVTGSAGKVEDRFKNVVKQLLGETGQVPPPDFVKVAEVNIDPNATTPMVGMSRDELLEELRRLKLHRYCAPGGGHPVVDKIVFTNHPLGETGVPTPNTSVFTCAELLPPGHHRPGEEAPRRTDLEGEQRPGLVHEALSLRRSPP
ncbi:hypothetical protein [Streptomyces sp. NBC_01363]|uniref:hypothetical protein n=1 Tax=Streptomyces sp. NBC_01363 TaxID=2903840 RepID=UPI00225A75FD|nr:hypothetical protein [Streptomyces sp. NBC_01363]MCX4734347.1 hypothetical protein [Streptomyces sp. NBC_01363]